MRSSKIVRWTLSLNSQDNLIMSRLITIKVGSTDKKKVLLIQKEIAMDYEDLMLENLPNKE